MDTSARSDTTAEAPSLGIDNDLAEREAAISAALRGISEVAVSALNTEKAPPEIAPLLNHGFTLLYCGLMALTEIAAAQTEMVALAKRDFAAEVEAAAKPKAAAIAQEIKDSETKRSFIGQKP